MKNIYARGRKIPFENVAKNLRRGRYRGPITSADYANTGLQLFMGKKFADNLGVPLNFLFEIGLLYKQDNCGWDLVREPTIEELLNKKEEILNFINTYDLSNPTREEM